MHAPSEYQARIIARIRRGIETANATSARDHSRKLNERDNRDAYAFDFGALEQDVKAIARDFEELAASFGAPVD